jgi:chromosome segregation ATPase
MRCIVSTMPKYIFELAGYLFVAILFGIGVGWLIWGDEPFEATQLAGQGDDESLHDLHAQVETRDQEIVRLRKRLKRLHADIDAQGLQLTEAKTESDGLQALVTQRESELEQLLGGNPLPQDGEMHIRRISELEEELAASRSESDGLARRLQERLEVVPTESADTDGLQTRLMDLTSSHTTLSDDHAQLLAAHGELQRSFGLVSNELSETQAKLEEGAASGPDLAQLDKIRVLEGEIARLKAQAVEPTPQSLEAGDLGDLQLELAKVQAELARSRQSVATLRERSQNIEDENEILAGDLARATAELQGRSAKHAEFAAQNEQLLAELQGLRTGSTQVQQEAEQVQQRAVEMEQRAAEMEQRALQADHVTAELQARLSELESHAHQESTAKVSLERELASTRDGHESTLAQLKQDLADARLRADGAYESLNGLHEEFISFREATLKQQTSMNTLADRLAKANSAFANRTSTSAELSDGTPADGDAAR